MGDYLATIQKPHTVYDITPSKQYTWGDYKDFGNSLRTGFVNNTASSKIAGETVTERQSLSEALKPKADE